MGVLWIDPYKFAVTDPFFSSVVSLLHFEGADGSTTFTDVTGKTWTAIDNAQIDTAQFRFGTSSGLFDGTNDALSTAGSADWAFGTGDFTIEAFVRINSFAAANHLYDGRLTSGTTTPNGGPQPNIVISNSTTIQYTADSGLRISGNPSMTTGVWYHIALSRVSGNTRLFVDGVQVGSTFVDSINYTNPGNGPRIGRIQTTATAAFNGWIDEFRVTKGVGRYASNFTPPSEPFPDA